MKLRLAVDNGDCSCENDPDYGYCGCERFSTIGDHFRGIAYRKKSRARQRLRGGLQRLHLIPQDKKYPVSDLFALMSEQWDDRAHMITKELHFEVQLQDYQP